MHASRCLPLALLAIGSPALAYETDQLTDRGEPLEDISAAANQKMNEWLDEAIAATNRRTRCAEPTARTQRVLAAQIHHRVARPKHVWERGPIGGLGFGVFSAWLETADLARRSFDDRRDVFADLRFTEAVILHTVGTCSTVHVAGVLVGTDKFDHFLDEGYRYAQRSWWGQRPDRAVRYGTRSERSIYGMMTSNAFSYADLRANWDGYRFYTSLLGPESVVQQAPDGCLQRTRSYDWGAYIDGAYDEVLDPPVFTRKVTSSVRERIAAHRDLVCRGYEAWGPNYETSRATLASSDPPWVGPEAPHRTDPWGLDQLCRKNP